MPIGDGGLRGGEEGSMGTAILSHLLLGSIKGPIEVTPTSTAQGVVGMGYGRNRHRHWFSEHCASQSFWDGAPSLMSDLDILGKKRNGVDNLPTPLPISGRCVYVCIPQCSKSGSSVSAP